MAAVALETTLMAAQEFVESQTTGRLPPYEDPFHYDSNTGAAVQAQSSAGHHLTWGILHLALRGLWQCLVIGKASKEAAFELEEKGRGMIGSGSISANTPLSPTM